MARPAHDFRPDARPVTDAAQDWLVVQDPDGRLVARTEAEYTWRDDDIGVRLYVLISPTGRGVKLDVLNKNGLVLVDIKPNLVRINITDVVNKLTYRYQWVDLWGEIVPEESKYHLSADNKRICVYLHKKHKVPAAAPWGSLLDIRLGKYTRSELGWPGVLCQVQGTWRSEDEEPIEIVGHQVVWPEGSRDFMHVSEEDETFHLLQQGDGEKVVTEEFHGFFERHSERIKWDDGDFWTRISGLAMKRMDAGKQLLPLEYDTALARWVPWLPPDELRRQITHWLPPNGAEITVEVKLSDDPGLDLKRQLLASVGEDEDSGLTIANFDYIPLQLSVRCRVCALSGVKEMEGSGLVATMLALRDFRRVSLDNEAAALGGLERWLQWLRCWLAPGSRRNVEGALEAVRERLYEVMKDERQLAPATPQARASRGKLGLSYDRWPPLWTCTLTRPNDILKATTDELLAGLRRERSRGEDGLDPRRAFGDTRRRIAETLLDKHQVHSGTRRCDPLERLWIKRYSSEASRALFERGRTKTLRRELSEGGVAIVEDCLDWGTLVKIQGEVARLFGFHDEGAGAGGTAAVVPFLTARGGHTHWASVWETKLEDSGLTALSAACSFMRQLPARLNEWGYDGCTWTVEDPVVWRDDGQTLIVGEQKSLEWEPPEDVDAARVLGAPADDEEGVPVPPERCLLAFLFLNPPAWVPEWGGALRCHLAVDQDIYGDGGRLVLLHEVRGYALLPSTHVHTVLMARLQGAHIAGPRLAGINAPPRTEAEKETQNKLLKEIVPPVEEEKRPARPESYSRELTNSEVRRLGRRLGACEGGSSEEEEDEDNDDDNQKACGVKATTTSVGSLSVVAPPLDESAAQTQEPVEVAGIKDAVPEGVMDAVAGVTDMTNEVMPEVIPVPKKKHEEEPMRLELGSHQAIRLFETCFGAAFFKLD